MTQFHIHSKHARELLGDDYINQLVITHFLDEELNRLNSLLMKNTAWWQSRKWNAIEKKYMYLYAIWKREQYKLEQIQIKFDEAQNSGE